MDYQEANYLMHYGVPGMRWGHRKQRVTSGVTKSRGVRESNKNSSAKSENRKSKLKTAVKVGAGVAAAGLAVYGSYKTSQLIKNKSMRIQMERGVEACNRITNRGLVKSISVGTYKDNTQRIAYTKGRTSAVLKPSKKVSSEALMERVDQYNDAVQRKARNALEKNMEAGRNMNTIDAAKNIYNYHKEKKRRK